MKMYIIVKDDIPDKLVPVITAHASLACYKKYESNEDMIKWINGIFKKVVCIANDIEFDRLKNETDFVLLTESYLDNKEVCLAFCPREIYSKKFQFLKMWTPQNISNGKSSL
ncbi:aminoacyl-tRNA hydrolase [Flavobacterium johnsoniae]|uniref:Peptidyl-tRNA hydrolase PTH2 n=1 Tax=Flavobacterium johnsoniae TaxID=986 RepID=A0A1M5W4N7_FLAJO|nr:peptidyl-tRNA hydrolase [Flavobacterium johnsoniae]SHH82482.1 Peptidyl-tRNA hydrolase PTH2 [Flavobacterium johnsoniae]